MKIADIRKIDRSKLPNEDFKSLYDDLKKDSGDFDPDFIELYDEAIMLFLTQVKKYVPEAITEKVVKQRQPRKKAEKPIDFEDGDVVETVMEDYNLSREKAVKLIALRKEAYELKKENFEKLISRLDKSEFYQGKNSNVSIDKGRTRDLAKDSKQSAITLSEELKMTGRPFKRISKAGRKNQYGTTKGGKVYYEYRMNRRDVDKKIKLENGGGVGIPNSDKMFHLPFEIAVYVPSTKDVDKTITATELRARVKEVEKYLAETFGGFTSAEKVGGYLSSKSSVITEKVIPVTSFASMQSFKENKSKLVNKISVWAKKWGQEAIGFEFEGDLYYVPQKFNKGGKLTATYIPNRDIKSLTTVWGNNIKGKDLIDGAYTIRKDIKTQPKMVRSMFEEEEFSEFLTGGVIAYSNDDYEQKVGNFSSLAEAKKFAIANRLKYATITFEDEYGDNIVVTNEDTLKDIDWLFSDEFKKGGRIHTLNGREVWRWYPEWETSIIEKGDIFYYGNSKNDSMGFEVIDFTEDDVTFKVVYGSWGSRKIGDVFKETASKVAHSLRKDYYKDSISDFENEEFSDEYKKGGKTKPKEPVIVRGFADDEGYEYAKGGMVDLFEDYEKIPPKVQVILDKYAESFEDGDYQGLAKAHKELDKIGYTFEYYLDGQAYGLRPTNVPLNKLKGYEEFAKGGMTAHGFKVGDTIIDDMFWENKIVVKNKDGKRAMINIETGLRTTEK